MSTVTITVLDAAGKPQQFTAEPDAERWVYIPRGTKPAEPWMSECEAQYKWAKFAAFENATDKCACVDFHDTQWEHRIRPSGGRDWSAIQPQAATETPMCEKCVPESPAESDGEFAVRMLRGCTASVVIRPDYCGSVGKDKTISLADALRLAALIGGGK